MIVRACRSSDIRAAFVLINAAANADRTRRMTEAAFWGAFTDDQIVNYNAAVVSLPTGQGTGGRQNAGSTLAGFIWWDLPRSSTVKFEGWVHPDARRMGVGTAMLTAVESYNRREVPIRLTGRVYEDIPGGVSLFHLRGYAETRRYYMMSMPLSAPIPDVPVSPGVVIRTFRPEDIDALVDADNAIFDGHWESSWRSVQVWQHEMIMSRPHDPALWILAWDGDRVVGECLSHLSREAGPQDAWVSIVGVRKDWRGRGLGRAVLAKGLQAVQQAGYKTASLHVDSANTPALRLYRRLGMEVARTRVHFAKRIAAQK